MSQWLCPTLLSTNSKRVLSSRRKELQDGIRQLTLTSLSSGAGRTSAGNQQNRLQSLDLGGHGQTQGTRSHRKQGLDLWHLRQGADCKEAEWALPEGTEMFCILMVVVTHTNTYVHTHIYTHILNSLGTFCHMSIKLQ